uniref:Small-subunit processome Utp12 domain-containing protein n=2 Tax=Araucaria cunninghamii TaxID=56994 RepID=A0A0D6R1B9_ARACU
MVKSYLRYEAGAVFGVVTSHESNVTFDNTGKLLLCGALEQLAIWNVKQGSCVKKLAYSSETIAAKPAVTSIVWMPNSVSTVACGYGDGSIRIWDTIKGTCETTLNGHKGATTALSYNKTGYLLASGSKDTDIVIWDAVGEAGLFRLRGHRDQVTDLVFLEGGKRLVSSSRDNLMRIWDLDTQHCMQIVSGHHSEIWSIDVDLEERFLVTGSADQELRVYKIHKEMHKEENISGEAKLANQENNEDQFVRQNKWEVLSHFGNIKRQSKDRVVTIRFNSTGSLLACQVAGKVVEIFCVLDEKEALKKAKRKIHRKREKALKKTGIETANNGGIEPVEKLENDPVGISASNFFQFLHILRAKHKIRSISFCPVQPRKGFMATVALSLHNNTLEVYEVGKESSMQIHAINLPGHGSDIRSLKLSSDNSLLMSTSHNSVKIWNPSTCSCLRTMEAGYGLCGSFVPGNRYAFVGTKSGTVEIFDIGAGERFKVIEAHSASVWSLVPTLDGSGFITGSADHDVKFWEYQLLKGNDEGSQQLTAHNVRTLKMTEDVLLVRLSPTGKHIAVALLDSTIKVFFVDTLKFFLSLYGHKLPVLCMDISSDGDLLVSGSADKNLKIWGLDFGDCHKSLFAHADSVMAVQFVRNTHYMFSVGKDRLVKYWDADKFELLLTLEGHHAEVWCLAVSSHGDFVVTGSHDRSVRRWDRTEEPFFIEEEREKRLENMFDSGLDDTADGPFALKEEIPEEGAVGLPGKKTQETVDKTDSIIEALDTAEAEIQRLRQHEEDTKNGLSMTRFQPNIMMRGLSPSAYVLRAVSDVRTNDLEQTLLALPFTDALKLFSYLKEWISDGDKVELVCRIATLLLQIHYQQLISTPAARSILTAIQGILRSRVKGCKDVLGFNLAVMDHIKQLLAARSDAPFKDVTSKLVDIRTRLSKRIDGKTKSDKKEHKKRKKFHRIHVAA